MTVRFLALVLTAVLTAAMLAGAQDQSRAIQAQQQRQIEARAEEQRRDMVRAEQQRQAQAREERELAARRRAEAAQLERHREAQRAETPVSPPAPQPDSVAQLDPVAAAPSAGDSTRAEPSSAWALPYQVARVALVSGCSILLLGMLLRRGLRRVWR